MITKSRITSYRWNWSAGFDDRRRRFWKKKWVPDYPLFTTKSRVVSVANAPSKTDHFSLRASTAPKPTSYIVNYLPLWLRSRRECQTKSHKTRFLLFLRQLRWKLSIRLDAALLWAPLWDGHYWMKPIRCDSAKEQVGARHFQSEELLSALQLEPIKSPKSPTHLDWGRRGRRRRRRRAWKCC